MLIRLACNGKNLNKIRGFDASSSVVLSANPAFPTSNELILGTDPFTSILDNVPQQIRNVQFSFSANGGLDSFTFDIDLSLVDFELSHGDLVKVTIEYGVSSESYYAIVDSIDDVSDSTDTLNVSLIGAGFTPFFNCEIDGRLDYVLDESGSPTSVVPPRKLSEYVWWLVEGFYFSDATTTINIYGLKDYSPIQSIVLNIDSFDNADDYKLFFTNETWFSALTKLVRFLNLSAGYPKYWWCVKDYLGQPCVVIDKIQALITKSVDSPPFSIIYDNSEYDILKSYSDNNPKFTDTPTNYKVILKNETFYYPDLVPGTQSIISTLNLNFLHVNMDNPTEVSELHTILDRFRSYSSKVGSFDLARCAETVISPIFKAVINKPDGNVDAYVSSAAFRVTNKVISGSFNFGSRSSFFSEFSSYLENNLTLSINSAVKDSTPPSIQLSLSAPTVANYAEIGVPTTIYITAEDDSGINLSTLKLKAQKIIAPASPDDPSLGNIVKAINWDSAPAFSSFSAALNESGNTINNTYTAEVDFTAAPFMFSSGDVIAVCVEVEDVNGNFARTSPVTYKIDITPPTVNTSILNKTSTINTVTPEVLEGGSARLRITVSDTSNIKKVACFYNINNTSPTGVFSDLASIPFDTTENAYVAEIYVPPEDGVVIVKVFSEDFAGNIVEDSSLTVVNSLSSDVPDTTPPSISFGFNAPAVKNLQQIGSPIRFFLSITDEGSGVDSSSVAIKIVKVADAGNYTDVLLDTIDWDAVPSQPVTYNAINNYYYADIDLKSLGFVSRDVIAIQASCSDLAGNVAVTSPSVYQVDSEPPVVRVDFISDPASTDTTVAPKSIKNGAAQIRVKVTDISAIDWVRCNYNVDNPDTALDYTEYADLALYQDENEEYYYCDIYIPPEDGDTYLEVYVKDIFQSEPTVQREYVINDLSPYGPDFTPPQISLLSGVPTPSTMREIGSPADFYITVKDDKTGVDQSSVAIQIAKVSISTVTGEPQVDAIDWTSATSYSATYNNENDYYYVRVNIANDFNTGDIIAIRCTAKDLAGNEGFTSVSVYKVDTQAPSVSISFQNVETDPEPTIEPKKLLNGRTKIKVKVSDASSTTVTCDWFVDETDGFVNDPRSVQLADYRPLPYNETTKAFEGVVEVPIEVGPTYLRVYATDVFGFTGVNPDTNEVYSEYVVHSEYIGPEDTVPPRISIVKSVPQPRDYPEVGSPLKLMLHITDEKTGVDQSTIKVRVAKLDVGQYGIDYYIKNIDWDSVPAYSVTQYTDPDTGSTVADVYWFEADIKTDLSLQSGDIVVWAVEAADNEGNFNRIISEAHRVDVSPPVVSISFETEQTEPTVEPTKLLNGQATLVVRVEDSSAVQVFCDWYGGNDPRTVAVENYEPIPYDASRGAFVGQVNVPLEVGPVYLKVYAQDVFGNIGISPKDNEVYSVYVVHSLYQGEEDVTPPSVSVSFSAATKSKYQQIGSPVTLFINTDDTQSGVDPASVKLYVHRLLEKVSDDVNNIYVKNLVELVDWSTVTTTYTPTQYVDPNTGQPVDGVFTVTIDFKNDLGFNAGDIVALRAYCKDAAGNEAWSSVSTYQVDIVAPTGSVSITDRISTISTEVHSTVLRYGFANAELKLSDISSILEVRCNFNSLNIPYTPTDGIYDERYENKWVAVPYDSATGSYHCEINVPVEAKPQPVIFKVVDIFGNTSYIKSESQVVHADSPYRLDEFPPEIKVIQNPAKSVKSYPQIGNNSEFLVEVSDDVSGVNPDSIKLEILQVASAAQVNATSGLWERTESYDWSSAVSLSHEGTYTDSDGITYNNVYKFTIDFSSIKATNGLPSDMFVRGCAVALRAYCEDNEGNGSYTDPEIYIIDKEKPAISASLVNITDNPALDNSVEPTRLKNGQGRLKVSINDISDIVSVTYTVSPGDSGTLTYDETEKKWVGDIVVPQSTPATISVTARDSLGNEETIELGGTYVHENWQDPIDREGPQISLGLSAKRVGNITQLGTDSIIYAEIFDTQSGLDLNNTYLEVASVDENTLNSVQSTPALMDTLANTATWQKIPFEPYTGSGDRPNVYQALLSLSSYEKGQILLVRARAKDMLGNETVTDVRTYQVDVNGPEIGSVKYVSDDSNLASVSPFLLYGDKVRTLPEGKYDFEVTIKDISRLTEAVYKITKLDQLGNETDLYTGSLTYDDVNEVYKASGSILYDDCFISTDPPIPAPLKLYIKAVDAFTNESYDPNTESGPWVFVDYIIHAEAWDDKGPSISFSESFNKKSEVRKVEEIAGDPEVTLSMEDIESKVAGFNVAYKRVGVDTDWIWADTAATSTWLEIISPLASYTSAPSNAVIPGYFKFNDSDMKEQVTAKFKLKLYSSGIVERGSLIELIYVAVDRIGNVSSTSAQRFKVDTTEPKVNLSVDDYVPSSGEESKISYSTVSGPFRIYFDIDDASYPSKIEVYRSRREERNATTGFGTLYVELSGPSLSRPGPNWDDDKKKYFIETHARYFTGKWSVYAKVTDEVGLVGYSDVIHLKSDDTDAGDRGEPPEDTVDRWKKKPGDESQVKPKDLDGRTIVSGSVAPDALAEIPFLDYTFKQGLEQNKRVRFGWNKDNDMLVYGYYEKDGGIADENDVSGAGGGETVGTWVFHPIFYISKEGYAFGLKTQAFFTDG